MLYLIFIMESGYIFPTDGDSRTVSVSDARRGKSVNQLWSIEVDAQVSAGDTLAALRMRSQGDILASKYTAGDTSAAQIYRG